MNTYVLVVNILWEDYNNIGNVRPESITIKYNDGVDQKEKVILSSDSDYGNSLGNQIEYPFTAENWCNIITSSNDISFNFETFQAIAPKKYFMNSFEEFVPIEYSSGENNYVYKFYRVTFKYNGSIFSENDRKYLVDRYALERYTDMTINGKVVNEIIGGRPMMMVETPEMPEFTIQNDEYFFETQDNRTFISNNNGVNNSNARTTLKFSQNAYNLSLLYDISSENNFDKGSITFRHLGSEEKYVDNVSGTMSSTIIIPEVSAEDELIIEYSKDSSQSSGSDKFTVQLLGTHKEAKVSLLSFIDNRMLDLSNQLYNLYSSIETNNQNITNLNDRIGSLENIVSTIPGVMLTFEECEQKLYDAIGGRSNVIDGYNIHIINGIAGSGLNSYYPGYITESQTTANVGFFEVYTVNSKRIDASNSSITLFLKDPQLIDYSKIDVGGNACFTKDTIVKTSEGYKEIGLIKPGDSVIGYNNGEVETKVREINIHKNVSKIFKIDFGDTEIGVTADHEILTDSGYKNVNYVLYKELLGEKVKDYNIVKNEQELYDIVTDTGNYVLKNGLVARSEKMRNIKEILICENGKININ